MLTTIIWYIKDKVVSSINIIAEHLATVTSRTNHKLLMLRNPNITSRISYICQRTDCLAVYQSRILADNCRPRSNARLSSRRNFLLRTNCQRHSIQMEQILDQTSGISRSKHITGLHSICPSQRILNWIWVVDVLSLIMLELMLVSEASDISLCRAIITRHTNQHLIPTGMLHDFFPEALMQLSYKMPSRWRLIKLVALLIGIELRQNFDVLN